MTKQITVTVNFRSITDEDDEKIGEGFMINTSELSILFPLTKNFLEEDRFKESFLEFMASSSGFTHV